MTRKPKPSSASKRPAAQAGRIQLISLPGLPEIHKGDNLARLIFQSAADAGIAFEKNDVVVAAQKIVSKSEGRVLRLSGIQPSPDARKLASSLKKDPRFIEVILRQTRRVVRSEHVLIVETHHGFVCANAGVDRSNVPGRDCVALLPKNPDESARNLAAALKKLSGKTVAVILSDTFGRPWRLGLTNVAIGAAGIPVLRDLRGQRDRNRKQLHATILAVADEIAAAAGLLMGKSDGTPVVIVRGFTYRPSADRAARIVRPPHEDLFR
jgi:coenzyme F420-0:L-glutamate ligase / coenzyme F420-1:gamma-L-glutamate ligase